MLKRVIRLTGEERRGERERESVRQTERQTNRETETEADFKYSGFVVFFVLFWFFFNREHAFQDKGKADSRNGNKRSCSLPS